MKKIYYLLLLFFAAFILFAVIKLFPLNFSGKVVVEKNNEVVLPNSLSERIGQNFIVGIEGKTLDEKTKIILEKIKPAGIILYYRNFENPEQFKNLISQLQILAKDTTGHPYFIMIDEEPGGAARLDLFNNVFAFGVPDWDQIKRAVDAMANIGINVDLAPIADFAFDDNAFIKDRIPTRNIDSLVDFNNKFISILNQNHILATLKHFPGMGVFVQDPHETLPYANPDQTTISKSINIFKEGITGGADFVMTCHCVYDDIDPNNPGTLSKKITTDILRNEVGFAGLAITDDLSEMPFIINKKVDLAQATAQAIEAGHNLVMFSHRPEETEKIFNKLVLLVESDQNLKALIGQNYIKVISLKNNKL